MQTTFNTGQNSHVQKYMLAIFCAMSFILYLDRVNLAAAAGPIKDELGLSNTTLGLAFSAFGYTYAIFQIIGGWFADRLGAKKTLIVCGSIWVVATIATGFVSGLFSLVLARLLLGIGEGAALPAQARAIANWFQRKDRGFVQGITHSFSRLGNALAPPIVALLIVLHSWRAAFFIVGVLTSLWILAWILYYKDNPRQHRSISEQELARLPVFEQVAAGSKDNTPWKKILRRMAPTIFVYFCQVWTNTLFFSWIPIFFMNAYQLDLKKSAIFASGVFFAGVVGDVTGGLISDKVLKRSGSLPLARQGVIAFSLLGALAFLVPVMLSRDVNVVVWCLAGAFFMLELTIGPIWAVPMDIAPKFAGTASGMLNTGAALATIISPVVFGTLIDLTGNWSLPFVGSALFLVIGAIATTRIRPDRDIEHGAADSAAMPVESAAG